MYKPVPAALAAAVSQYEMPKNGVVHQLLVLSPDPEFYSEDGAKLTSSRNVFREQSKSDSI